MSVHDQSLYPLVLNSTPTASRKVRAGSCESSVLFGGRGISSLQPHHQHEPTGMSPVRNLRRRKEKEEDDDEAGLLLNNKDIEKKEGMKREHENITRTKQLLQQEKADDDKEERIIPSLRSPSSIRFCSTTLSCCNSIPRLSGLKGGQGNRKRVKDSRKSNNIRTRGDARQHGRVVSFVDTATRTTITCPGDKSQTNYSSETSASTAEATGAGFDFSCSSRSSPSPSPGK